ncbi:MAG: hypothetical protein B6229_04405 [Spirochaetaceae bacterium 4572_7]|nr:MAG: hypothetical protein B6229_04405 [Spirochaetaceae bacterium 4572_7]
MINNKLYFKTQLKGVSLLIFILLFNSCSFGRIFGLKKDEFMNKVLVKDYKFLSDVDYSKDSITQINRLGRGASYYMSFVYKDNDMRLFSNKLLYQEIQNKDSFYGPKATTQLLKQLLQEKDYIKTEAHALDYFDSYNIDNPQITKQLIEAMYWQKKDSQVLPYIDNLDRSNYSDYANYELDLLKCVSSARLGLEGWEDQYRGLFLNQSLSPILKRAYSFIDVYPEYGESFSKAEKSYFRALALGSAGDYYNAQRIIRPLLLNEDWVLSTKQSIINISKIIKSSRVITANLKPFMVAMNRLEGEVYNNALVSYSSLYFNIERFSSVVNLLEDNLDSIEFGKAKDDALWLYLLSLSHIDSDRIVSRLEFYMDKLSGDNYGTAILDHVITTLVQGRKWESIIALNDVIKDYGSVSDSSRLSWIISRIYYYDYIFIENKESEIRKFLDDIVLTDNYSYYSFLANALLKKESNLVLPLPPEKVEINTNDQWILGFLRYGLEDEALLFSKQVKNINYSVLIEVSRLLDKESKHLEALRFMGKNNVPLNTDSFSLYYPLPYKDNIVEVASMYNFPYVIYSGLIRTESGFDMDVVSVAGAIGLSQLMPDTAKEQAQNLGIKDYDLNDPETNILFGGSYLNWLIGKYDSIPLSCLAYNAGPGNVWSWQRLWGDLPDELFIEAVPFKETRDYFPKTLKASIYYGHEEFDLSPYEVVKKVFPNIY